METVKSAMNMWMELFTFILPSSTEPITVGLISFLTLVVIGGAIPYLALVQSLNDDKEWIESDDRKRKVHPGKLGRKIYG